MSSSFAKKLNEIMNEKYITQQELAKAINTSKASVSLWLSGKIIPSAKSIKKLEEYFNINLQEINIDLQEINIDSNEMTSQITKSRNLTKSHSVSINSTKKFKKLTIEETSRRIGKSKAFIRNSLIQGTCPFGYAALMDSGKYDYHISPKKLDEYAYLQEDMK